LKQICAAGAPGVAVWLAAREKKQSERGREVCGERARKEREKRRVRRKQSDSAAAA